MFRRKPKTEQTQAIWKIDFAQLIRFSAKIKNSSIDYQIVTPFSFNFNFNDNFRLRIILQITISLPP
jgi:hypothetical protein